MMKFKLKPLSALILMLMCSFVVNGKDIYVSADKGNDTKGKGTKESPYETISKGVAEAKTGTNIIIREGIYRESIKIEKNDITLSAYPGEYVLVSGLTTLDEWEKDNNGRWVAKINRAQIDPGLVYTQFFADGERCEPARYPNEDGDKFSFFEWMDTETFAPAIEKGDTAMVHLSRSFPENYWKGGYYLGLNSLMGNNFNSAKGVIASSNANELEIEKICWNWKIGWTSSVGKGQGYIIHHINALDAPGEWYYDDRQSLYYMPKPGEDMSAGNYEIRTKLYVMELVGCKNVTVKGLNFKAGLLILDQANNCTVDGCTFRYLTPFSAHVVHPYGSREDGSWGVYVTGEGNTITNNYFGSSWASCLTLDGTNTIVKNNILRDGNWMAERFGLMNIHSKGDKITHNTVYDAGRGAVDGGNRAWIYKWGTDYEFGYNHLYNSMMLSVDGGVFYINTKDRGKILNVTLHHNWVSAGDKGELMRGRGKNGVGHARAGLYVDDNTSGVIMHHNVVYKASDATKTNQYGILVGIYNTTIIDCMMSQSQWEPHPGRDRDVITANNIAAADAYMDGSENRNNYYIDREDDIWVDWRNLDFRLKPNSGAIDAGVVVDGVTGEFNGAAPDAGAYEYGQERWVAGADWSVSDEDFKDQKSYITFNDRVEDLFVVYPQGATMPELQWSEDFEGDYKINVYQFEDAGKPITKIGVVDKGVCRFEIENFVEAGKRSWFFIRLEYPDGRLLPLSNDVPYLRHDTLDDICATQTMESMVQMIVRSLDAKPLAGDVGQFTRMTVPDPGSKGHVAWHVAQIKDFDVSLFLHRDNDLELFSFFLSEDGVRWREVTSDINFSAIEEIEPGLWSCQATNGALSGRDNFIKIKIAGTDASRLDYPEISHLKVNLGN